MALSLNKLCSSVEKKYRLKLIAGKDGMDSSVRWVHMVEDTEVPDFLHGNELVFTTGIANHQSDWLLKFVKNLKSNNAAGLVINLGPYIESIPPQVIVFCEQNDFPLMTIPWETRIIDITYKFCRILINAEKQEQSLAEAFKNLILNPEDKKGYEATLERNNFFKESNYIVVAMSFENNAHNITSKFLLENEARFTKIIKITPSPKAHFMWNKNFLIIYQNTSYEQVKSMCKKIENICIEKRVVKPFIGISDMQKGYYSMGDIYAQAISALKLARIKLLSCMGFCELGVYKLLLNMKSEELLKEFYNSTLGVLVEYDKEHDTDLYNTLKNYCMGNGSVNELAENAGVHRNTINYKMKKIKEILKTEINYDTIMNLMLAFNIADISIFL